MAVFNITVQLCHQLKNKMKELLKKLKEKGLTLSCCESLTGGLFASSIVEISGASEVFVGGYVTYQNQAKELILDGQNILKSYGAISKEMAYRMASKAKNDFKSDLAISFTGNAGPDASEEKEVGLVFICLIIKGKVYYFEKHYQGDRKQIRFQCIEDAKKEILSNI